MYVCMYYTNTVLTTTEIIDVKFKCVLYEYCLLDIYFEIVYILTYIVSNIGTFLSFEI